MSDTVLLAIIASMAPTLMALAALAVSFRNLKKSDVIIEKAAEIHTLTNSNLSQITAALGVANEKILGLEKLISATAETKKEAQIKAESDAQKLLTEAVVLASKKVNEAANQPNSLSNAL